MCAGPFSKSFMYVNSFDPHNHPGKYILFIPFLSWGTERCRDWQSECAPGRCLLGSPAYHGMRSSEGDAAPASASQPPLTHLLPHSVSFRPFPFPESIAFYFLSCGAVTGSSLEVPATSCPSSSV